MAPDERQAVRAGYATHGERPDDKTWAHLLPKVELHVHLDGAFDPALLFELAKKRLGELPENTESAVTGKAIAVRDKVASCEKLEDFEKLITCKGQRSLKAMLDCFNIFLPCVRGDLNAVEEMSYRFCCRQAKENVVYTEVRYSPHLLLDGEYFSGETRLDPEAAVAAVTRGLRRGCREHGIVVNQILCCISFQPSWSTAIVDLALKHRDAFPCAVVGIDVAAGEVGDDPAQHAPAFQRANELGIKATLHAGEMGGPENVRHAVFDFRAARVGHGYAAADQPELLKDCVAEGAHFEVCPTSSQETGAWHYTDDKPPWPKHPLHAMLEAGASVSINSDDPSVFVTDLTEEFCVCLRAGLTRQEALQLNRNALQAAFGDRKELQEVRRLIDAYAMQMDPVSVSA
ncbi:unnamed protein product [Effrenium voratum]|nr:unnamed protein product [Effrenium voratum]